MNKDQKKAPPDALSVIRRAWVTGFRRLFPGLLCTFAAPALFAVSANNTVTNSASTVVNTGSGSASTTSTGMWGASPSAGGLGTGGAESANMNAANSLVAAYAHAASEGILAAPGTSVTIQSVGSQAIVSNSIYGNNNVSSISAHQTSNATGNTISNQGTFSGNAHVSISSTTVSGTTSSDPSANSGY